MLVSFIVPCYNVSRWVTRCLDSIYALDLSEDEFEVITVDDASTDDTLKLLEAYAEKHQNIKIVQHLVNRNLGAARNSGLSLATGRFITYVDSDDELSPGMAKALQMASSMDLDMVASRVQTCTESGECLKEDALSEPADRLFTGIEFQTKHPFWHSGIHGYVFSARLLNTAQYYFVEGAYYEDADYLYRHLMDAVRMAYCDECSYKYYQNPGSITQTMSAKHVFGYSFLGARMLRLYDALEDQSSAFAQSILEGGSFNLMRSYKLLLRLGSISEIRKYYNLLDARINRSRICSYNKPSYCWTIWTKLGLRHKNTMVFLSGIFVSLRLPKS